MALLAFFNGLGSAEPPVRPQVAMARLVGPFRLLVEGKPVLRRDPCRPGDHRGVDALRLSRPE